MAGWSGELGEAIARAQSGDQRAFDAIYERFTDALFRYLYARTGDRALAEELIGELWVRVVERLPAFRAPPAPGEAERALAAWLYRIAHNLAVDTMRRRGSSAPLSDGLASREPGPDERLIAEDERQAVRAAVERLSADQREVVLMRFFEQRSPAEVARLTGRSEGAVKVMQHRALGALARMLGVERRGKGR